MKLKRKAEHLQVLDSGIIKCTLCPVYCKLSDGQQGICFGRKNIDGTLYAVNYGEVVSVAVDPIEKKPLYHFHPGASILSLGPNGCNLRCENCQNWQISQEESDTRYIPPDNLVNLALNSHSIGIAYTYSEPLIWYEYIYDASEYTKNAGLKTVLVSNGYINEQPFRQLAPKIDAMNIDIKSMSEDFYRKICHSSLKQVMQTVEIALEEGIHLEITNLVITSLNDSDDDFKKLTDWIASLSKNIPLHFSRYFPQHKMDNPATPIARLEKAYKIAKEKLEYVYIGNVATQYGNDTLCPNCNNLIISRNGYQTEILGLSKDKCNQCGRSLNIRL